MTHIREWWYSNSMKGPGETNDRQNHSICGPDQVACRPWPWRQCVRQLGMQSAHYAYFAYLGPQSQVVTTTSFSSWHVLLHRVNMVHRTRCSLCHLTGGPCPDQGCQSFREACFTPEPFNSRQLFVNSAVKQYLGDHWPVTNTSQSTIKPIKINQIIWMSWENFSCRKGTPQSSSIYRSSMKQKPLKGYWSL